MAPFFRVLKTMLNPWVSISFIGFVFLSFFYFDKPIAYFFHHLNLKTNVPLLRYITKLGVGVIYVALLFLLGLVFRYFHRNKQWETRSWFLWLCVLIPNLITLILKILLGRARPTLLFDHDWYGFYGVHLNNLFWSCPSGHTTTVMGLVFGLMIVFPRYVYAFILAGLFVISTRIFLVDHYLSDVLITSYLVLLEVGLLSGFLHRKKWLMGI